MKNYILHKIGLLKLLFQSLSRAAKWSSPGRKRISFMKTTSWWKLLVLPPLSKSYLIISKNSGLCILKTVGSWWYNLEYNEFSSFSDYFFLPRKYLSYKRFLISSYFSLAKQNAIKNDTALSFMWKSCIIFALYYIWIVHDLVECFSI